MEKQVTSMQELIKWTTNNAFNIEGQYIAIDLEEMRAEFDKWLELEKEQIYDAHTDGYISHATEVIKGFKSSEQYYSEKFNPK